MVGRKRIGEHVMTPSERQRRKRRGDEMRAQRAEQARESLAVASVALARLWDRLNGNRKYSDIHDEIGKAADLCRRAHYLLSPVYHLPVSEAEPRRLICGSSDFEHVANSLTITLIHEERRCPECSRRRREFYP